MRHLKRSLAIVRPAPRERTELLDLMVLSVTRAPWVLLAGRESQARMAFTVRRVLLVRRALLEMQGLLGRRGQPESQGQRVIPASRVCQVARACLVRAACLESLVPRAHRGMPAAWEPPAPTAPPDLRGLRGHPVMLVRRGRSASQAKLGPPARCEAHRVLLALSV